RDLLLLAFALPHGFGARIGFFGLGAPLLRRRVGRLGRALLVLDFGQRRLRLARALDRYLARHRRILRRRLFALPCFACRTPARFFLLTRFLGRLLLGDRIHLGRFGSSLARFFLGARRRHRRLACFGLGNLGFQLALASFGLLGLALGFLRLPARSFRHPFGLRRRLARRFCLRVRLLRLVLRNLRQSALL